MSTEPHSQPAQADIRPVSCGACDMSELCEVTEQLRLVPGVHRAVLRTLHRGASLKEAQDRSALFFAVRKGLLKVVRTYFDDRRRVFGVYVAGDLIPAGLMDDASSPVDVIAVTDAMVCELDSQTVSSLCRTVPTTQDTVNWLLAHASSPRSQTEGGRCTAKLKGFLRSVSNRLRARGLEEIDLLAHLTQQELADILKVNRGAIRNAVKSLHGATPIRPARKRPRLSLST